MIKLDFETMYNTRDFCCDLSNNREVKSHLLLRSDNTAYASVAVGDKLVAGTDGKWSKSASVDDYSAYLEVIEKTSFCGNGLLVKVHA